MGDITELLDRANAGDEQALNAVFEALYGDLHDLARSRLRRHEREGSLDTTALVHESYLRLLQAGRLGVQNRAHFFAYAARTMRSVIVDFARRRQAERRGGGMALLTLDTGVAASGEADEEQVLQVHDALTRLSRVEPESVELVEMRYFGGYTDAEIAEVLGINERTVRRRWEKARLLLAVALEG